MSITEKNQLSILFIDEKITRHNYTRYLENNFIKVYEAETSDVAFNIYKEKKPNIIILEIDLQKGCGLELLEKIRENDLSTKVIMFTSNTQKDNLIKAAELKLSKFLEKPVKKELLLDAVLQAKSEIEAFQITCNKVTMLKNDLLWNFETKELKHHDAVINLTKIEEEILNKLLKKREMTVSYDELLVDIWNIFDSTKIVLVKTAIKKLRKKLPCDTILNIYGQGYKVL